MLHIVSYCYITSQNRTRSPATMTWLALLKGPQWLSLAVVLREPPCSGSSLHASFFDLHGFHMFPLQQGIEKIRKATCKAEIVYIPASSRSPFPWHPSTKNKRNPKNPRNPRIRSPESNSLTWKGHEKTGRLRKGRAVLTCWPDEASTNLQSLKLFQSGSRRPTLPCSILLDSDSLISKCCQRGPENVSSLTRIMPVSYQSLHLSPMHNCPGVKSLPEKC